MHQFIIHVDEFYTGAQCAFQNDLFRSFVKKTAVPGDNRIILIYSIREYKIRIRHLVMQSDLQSNRFRVVLYIGCRKRL